jgi:hypothetical protein
LTRLVRRISSSTEFKSTNPSLGLGAQAFGEPRSSPPTRLCADLRACERNIPLASMVRARAHRGRPRARASVTSRPCVPALRAGRPRGRTSPRCGISCPETRRQQGRLGKRGPAEAILRGYRLRPVEAVNTWLAEAEIRRVPVPAARSGLAPRPRCADR